MKSVQAGIDQWLGKNKKMNTDTFSLAISNNLEDHARQAKITALRKHPMYRRTYNNLSIAEKMAKKIGKDLGVRITARRAAADAYSFE